MGGWRFVFRIHFFRGTNGRMAVRFSNSLFSRNEWADGGSFFEFTFFEERMGGWRMQDARYRIDEADFLHICSGL